MRKIIEVFKLAFPYWGLWLVAMICMGVFTLCNTFSVMGLIPLIDKVLSNKPIAINLSVNIPYQDLFNSFLSKINALEPLVVLNFICVFLVVITIIKGIAQFVQQVAMEYVSQKISRDLRMKLFEKYFILPSSYYAGAKTGDLITKITMDVSVIQMIFSGRFTNTVLDSLHFFPFLIIVLLIDWRMTLVTVILVPLSMIPIILVGRQIRKISYKAQANLSDISSHVFETLNAMKIVKVFNNKKKEVDRFYAFCQKTIQARVKSQKKEAVLSPVTEFIGIIAGAFLLWWFAPNVLNGKMSLGVFITYITCIGSMIKPIKTLGKIQIMVQNGMAGADRIFDLLNVKNEMAEIEGKEVDVEFKDKLSFENVSFSYDNQNNVLNDISFTVKKGDIVALVGPSGSGKTTIANLIPRFFDPQKGSIKIDGSDLKALKASSIRKILAMVTQEPVLFNTSIFENIGYAKANPSLAEIRKVAALARADEFIMKMPKQYETVVGERGTRLSGGEKQRISIARALLKNPDLIIFDEATSALDAENEKLVQEAIDCVMSNRTVVVIAHRLSTVVKANKIIVIDKGKIVEMGTHKELLNNNGLYKKLFDLSFEL
ncbi:MAG: hypothetical protein ACD_79C00249G0019 [uncultured bacterium]|nr:MAG: hypothetical protein ACD_79C00249G0019 [uncultured bacterium]